MGRKKKSIWTEERLDVLYECWKAGQTTKERIPLIEEKLPDVPLPAAVSLMRKLARTDSKWVGWTTRKKNEKERAKIAKQQEKERKQLEREQRKKDREKKRALRERKQQDKELRQKLDNDLEMFHSEAIEEKVEPEFFFCPDTHQFVNTNSCIFRVFSKGFPSDPACSKCKRMDKYIPAIEEVIKDGRSKKRKRNQTSKGSENKVKKTADTAG